MATATVGVPPLTREGRAAWARRRLERGVPRYLVCEALGVRESGLRAILNDPDGSKQRARRERYRGVCQCGRKLDGSGGYKHRPRLCVVCAAAETHAARYWTRERVLEGIRTFAERRGRPPWSHEWLTGTEARTDPDGYVYPATSVVLRECGRWVDAIRDAGLEPPTYARAPKTLDYYLRRLRDISTDGKAPPSRPYRYLSAGLHRRGLTWVQASDLIGVEPRMRRRPRSR